MGRCVYITVVTFLGVLMCTPGPVMAQQVSVPGDAPAPEESAVPEDGSGGPGGSTFGTAAAIAGLPDCPESQTEVFFATYARDDTETSCATVLSCTNLDNAPRTVSCQFFLGFGNMQKGSDAVMMLGLAETGECATRDPDPTGIFVVNADADTGDFEGKGRVCADTARLACHAHLACSGAGLESLSLIKRGF